MSWLISPLDSRTTTIVVAPDLSVELSCVNVQEFMILTMGDGGNRRSLDEDYLEIDLSGPSQKLHPAMAPTPLGSKFIPLSLASTTSPLCSSSTALRGLSSHLNASSFGMRCYKRASNSIAATHRYRNYAIIAGAISVSMHGSSNECKMPERELWHGLGGSVPMPQS